MADFAELEEADGVRMTFNVWPNSRIEATKAVVPFACVYTPNKVIANMPVLPYEPVFCKCGAVLNPYARPDYGNRIWICAFCHARNHFPAHYAGINEQNLPAELFPSYCTVEYQLRPTAPISPPAYVFVVDTCLPEDELVACRTALSQALSLLPEYAQVGLVTFGTHVHVHELGFTEMAKCYVFQGTREYTSVQVQEQLGLMGKATAAARKPGQPAPPMGAPVGNTKRFVLPMQDCEFTINAVLDELQRDVFPTVSDHRPARCTGTALQVAAAMMGGCLLPGSCQARLLLFVGGPSTEGLGKVVDSDLGEPIRSHKDLAKEAAPHYKKAKKFYEQLGSQLVHQGHSLDLFACSLDQVGLAEMKQAVEQSGGMVVQTDTFHNPVFKESFRRVFAPIGDEGHLGLASNATVEVLTSRDVKVSGLLGPAAPIEKKSVAVAEQSVGYGGTTLWKLAGLDYTTSLAFFFEIVAQAGQAAADPHGAGQQFFLQYITKYLHADGSLRCRVTTVTRMWVDGQDGTQIIAGFDQEAAAVVVARLATYKMETEEDFDATRWLDRTLIRLSARFGEYRKDDPTSFVLSNNMSFFPQFLFNLRRSQFVQVFGNSPDETAYCRLYLNKEPVAEAMLMIQPTLMSYGFTGEVEPVLLDVSSILPDRILLLDSYFYVVVFHGSTIAQWRKAGYQDQPEHAAFKQLLEAPKQDAEALLKRRFPVPRLVDCDQNGSQARFLLAKLNPSATYNNTTAMSAEVIMTDDVSLMVFTEHLKKLAVQS
eukprot:jgi/Botrbrau1/8328/Bobra.0081s0017.1